MRGVCLPVALALLCASTAEAVISAAAISAAMAGIQAGTSLVGTSLQAMTNADYRVVCGIQVENWTKFTLSNPNVQIAGGALEIPPSSILPGRKEAMLARKTSDTATGSYGTVSWLIDSDSEFSPRRAVVMWSAPYDFNFHSNWLGLGLTSPGYVYHPTGDSWFDQMYYDSPGGGLGFARKDFEWDLSELLYADDKIQITGTMSSSHKAQVKITVRPQSENDLASSIKAIMKK